MSLIVQTVRNARVATVDVKMIAPRSASSNCTRAIPEMMPKNATANARAPTAGGRDFVFVASLMSEDSHACTILPVDGPKPHIEHPGDVTERESI